MAMELDTNRLNNSRHHQGYEYLHCNEFLKKVMFSNPEKYSKAQNFFAKPNL